MPIIGVIDSAKSGNLLVGAYEFIGTATVVGGSTSQVTINIPSTYKHLQVRHMARSNRPNTNGPSWCCPNNDTNTANYITQYFYSFQTSNAVGAGWSGSEGGIALNSAGNTASAGIFGYGVTTIFDYNSTSKIKTYVTNSGLSNNYNGDEVSGTFGGAWKGTAAITRLDFYPFTTPFSANSTFSVYGIKD